MNMLLYVHRECIFGNGRHGIHLHIHTSRAGVNGSYVMFVCSYNP